MFQPDTKMTTETFSNTYLQKLAGNKTDIISKNRVLPTSIIASKIFEPSEISLATSFGLSTLWLFGIDRYFDERDHSPEELKSIVDTIINKALEIENEANIALTDEMEDLVNLLQILLQDLSKYPSFSNFREILITSLQDTVHLGMGFIHSLKLSEETLTIEEYLQHAQESIGVKFVNFCVLVSDENIISLSDYDYIQELQTCSSLAIRLANDIVTSPKEEIEGNINFISLHSSKPIGISAATQLIKKQLDRLDKLVENSPVGLERFSRYVKNLVDTTLGFYKVSDFYDSADDLIEKHL